MTVAAVQLKSWLQGRDYAVFLLNLAGSFFRPLRCGSCCLLCEFCFRTRSGGFITRGLETFFQILNLAGSFFESSPDSLYPLSDDGPVPLLIG